MRAYQIDASLAGVIEFQDDVGELTEDLVVPGHVRHEDASDDAFAHDAVRRVVQ